jgi:anti-anti-sigma factor
MTGPRPTFEIHESQTSDFLRLSLTGELDRVAAPVLEDRLTRLRARKSPVRLDLSKLEFIDSTGIRLLLQSVGDARIKGWEFQIERDVAPQVMSVFRLVHMERFIG